MDHYTSIAHRLDQQRRAELIREAELIRRHAERAAETKVMAQANRPRPFLAAWRGILEFAHIGHGVAH